MGVPSFGYPPQSSCSSSSLSQPLFSSSSSFFSSSFFFFSYSSSSFLSLRAARASASGSGVSYLDSLSAGILDTYECERSIREVCKRRFGLRFPQGTSNPPWRCQTWWRRR